MFRQKSLRSRTRLVEKERSTQMMVKKSLPLRFRKQKRRSLQTRKKSSLSAIVISTNSGMFARAVTSGIAFQSMA